MSPPKSKKRKQARREERKRLERHRRRLARTLCSDVDIEIEPGGRPRMSDVLFEFVEPYAEDVDTEEEWRKLLTLATLAWNAALLPDEERQAMVDEVVAKGMPGAPEGLKADMKASLSALIARKKACFDQYRQMIVDFQLEDTDEGIHLSVASMLQEAQ